MEDISADLKNGGGLGSEISLEKLEKLALEVLQPVRFTLGLLNVVLDSVTDLLGRAVGSGAVRRHFHLLLSGLVLFGPALSLWGSKYSVFANSNNYLYRKFLRSTWGWTCLLSGSFVLLLSLSARRPPSVSLRHLSRVGLAGLLLWGCRGVLTVLEDAAGTCFEPVTSDPQSSSPLLLLHEDQTKASCLRARLQWRGYEVSQDVLVLCFCCLLLVEELSVFGRHRSRSGSLQKAPGAPLRLVFLLCVVLLLAWMSLLLCLLTYFPKFPSQQLGGALGYLGWRGLYQGWYRRGPGWTCPGLPEDGLPASADARKPAQ
ncbi:fat storage-inducing transmembrane protein 1-like [Salarias fasciatus]|uniref:Fat storage-inducing transmembrane protein 1 homolog n=1 Tax=Salarias fasciatus TaxID=181472 RepID=A0A672G7W4_SALFA|nr:fat storage-inducing transmembrane protein 1-like [Salarias fasciatus]